MAAQPQEGAPRQQHDGTDGKKHSGDNVIPPAQQQGNGILVFQMFWLLVYRSVVQLLLLYCAVCFVKRQMFALSQNVKILAEVPESQR
jgi:hypothetical protein